MKGAEQIQVKRLQNILAPNGALAYCCKERSLDPKISCVIVSIPLSKTVNAVSKAVLNKDINFKIKCK
jgi:hypothetical protein